MNSRKSQTSADAPTTWPSAADGEHFVALREGILDELRRFLASHPDASASLPPIVLGHLAVQLWLLSAPAGSLDGFLERLKVLATECAH